MTVYVCRSYRQNVFSAIKCPKCVYIKMIYILDIFACMHCRDHFSCEALSCTYTLMFGESDAECWIDCAAGGLLHRSAVIDRGAFRPPVEAQQGGM